MRASRRLTLVLLGLAAGAAGCGHKGGPGESGPPAPLASSAEAPPASAPVASSTAGADDEKAADEALPSGGPLVDLGGEYHAPPPASSSGAAHVYVRGMLVTVYAKPSSSSKKIGFLRAGAAPEANAKDAGTSGCPGGWREIAPAGFVCVGDKVTIEADDPIVKATMRLPDRSQKLPYMYGTVTRGGPAYSRIPTADDLKHFEPSLDEHMDKWRNDRVSGASYGVELWYKWSKDPVVPAWDAWEKKVSDAAIPFYLKDGATVPDLSGLVKDGRVKIDDLERRQGIAFIDSFLHEGRRYNVTTDLRVAPADRFRPIRGSDYHGVRIGVDVEFPFALIRKKGAKKWSWNASKKKMIEDGDIDYRAAVQLTGKQKLVGGVLHYEMKEGDWVDDRHASRLDPAKRMPKWGKNGEKWLDISISKQTLLAFEGEKAVYATLVSTGEDGLLDGARTTKKGIFRIHTKYVTTTMDSDKVGEEFELRDVPYVQYFEEGFALHGAYWHDAFGTPKSHGCINLAPEDARRLFHWTEPAVPPGWHGAVKPLTGTVLFVHP